MTLRVILSFELEGVMTTTATKHHARVYVTLKPTVNDPQGITIAGGLQSLGFSGVKSVRAGKFIEIELTATSEEDAREQVDAMCDRLLANPVIEKYTFDIDGR